MHIPTFPFPSPLLLLSLLLSLSLTLHVHVHAFPTTPNPHPPLLTSLAPRSLIGCFDPNTLPNPSQIPSLLPSDCYRAGHLLYNCAPNLSANMRFSRSASAQFRVPYHWTWESCTVIIDTTGPSIEEITSLNNVAISVMAIILKCVEQEPYKGGKTYVGLGNGLRVMVRGGGMPNQPKPPKNLVDECPAASTAMFGGGATSVST